MDTSATSTCSAELLTHVFSLPTELASEIIDRCIDTPQIESDLPDNALCGLAFQYTTNHDPSHFLLACPQMRDPCLRRKWLRRKWLSTTKEFTTAYNFVTAHLAIFLHTPSLANELAGIQQHMAHYWPSNEPPHYVSELWNKTLVQIPPVMRIDPTLNRMGLEKIELRLSMEDYFFLFDVRVQPVRMMDHEFYDPLLERGAAFLKRARSLHLVFQASNPWYGLQDGPWDFEDESGIEPRIGFGRQLCLKGLLVDWVLTYAWANNYLQHIPNITISGDIQPWVLEKWTQVFARTHPEQETIASNECLYAIEHHGQGRGGQWVPTEHYPPTCKCEKGCSGLPPPSEHSEWDPIPDFKDGLGDWYSGDEVDKWVDDGQSWEIL